MENTLSCKLSPLSARFN